MEQIHKRNTTITDKIFVVVFNLLLIISIYFQGNISLDDINIFFIGLPLLVIATFILHEYIHIFFFKLFSKGKANIKVIREKDLGAVIMYQENKDVSYSKYQTIMVLIAPLVLITIVSIPFMNNSLVGLLIKANMYLNIMGSSVDCTLIFKLLRKYKNNIKISYDYEKEKGVIMNIKKSY